MNSFDFDVKDFISNEFYNDTSLLKKEAETSPFDYSDGPVVDFRTFNESPEYLNKSVLSERQYRDCIAVIGDSPEKIFSSSRKIIRGVFLWGKGSGKDLCAARIMAYVAYVLLKFKDPIQTFFGKSGTKVDLINVAIKSDQAKDIFFDMLKTNITESPWFLGRYKIYQDNRVFSKPSDFKNQKGIIRIGSGKINFPKKIRAISETSDNESWEGYSPVMVLLDELSGFISKTKQLNGAKILETASTSISSRRSPTFCGFVLMLSYPRQEDGDITLTEYKKSLMIDEKTGLPLHPYIYGSFGFSWHIKPQSFFVNPATGVIDYFVFKNPRINRFMNKSEEDDTGIKVPLYYLPEAAEPESFMTKFMCIPKRGTISGWLENPEKAFSMINREITPLFILSNYPIEVETEQGTFKYLAKKIEYCKEKDFNTLKKMKYVAWLDAAEKHCDAVIGIARKEVVERTVDGQRRTVEICRVVEIINWIPQPDITISLTNVEDFLVHEIPKYINLVEVYSDGWQTARLEERLRNVGIKAERYSLQRPQYDLLKYALYNDLIEVFDEEPYVNRSLQEQTSVEQLVSLQEGTNGPIKRPGYKKDKADVICGCANLVLGSIYNKSNRPRVQKGDLASPIRVNPSITSSIDSNSPYLPGAGRIVPPLSPAPSNKESKFPRPVKM